MAQISSRGTTVTVGDSLTTVLEMTVTGGEYLGFQIENGTGAALDAFEVQVRVSNLSDNWVSIPISTDQSAPWPFFSTSDLTSLGTSTNAILAGVGRHWAQIRLQASVASGTTEITVYATGG
jgi:hypothetical protein